MPAAPPNVWGSSYREWCLALNRQNSESFVFELYIPLHIPSSSNLSYCCSSSPSDIDQRPENHTPVLTTSTLTFTPTPSEHGLPNSITTNDAIPAIQHSSNLSFFQHTFQISAFSVLALTRPVRPSRSNRANTTFKHPPHHRKPSVRLSLTSTKPD